MNFLFAWTARLAGHLRLPARHLFRAFWIAACLSAAFWMPRFGLADMSHAVSVKAAAGTELYHARLIAAGELIAIAFLAGLYAVLRRQKIVRRFR